VASGPKRTVKEALRPAVRNSEIVMLE